MLLPSFLDFSKTVAAIHVHYLSMSVSSVLGCKEEDRVCLTCVVPAHHTAMNVWAINSILFDHKDQNYTCI